MMEQLAEAAISLATDGLPSAADADARLLEELYDIYSEPLFRYALMLTCSRDDAEDIVQGVFIRIAREPKRLVGVEDPKAYLFSAVHNAAFNILRGRRRRKALQESIYAAFQVDQQLAGSEGRIECRNLCEALDDLPVGQREVLMLKILDEMTFKEIANAIGVSINTVASRYRYGIVKLRKALEVDDNG